MFHSDFNIFFRSFKKEIKEKFFYISNISNYNRSGEVKHKISFFSFSAIKGK